MPLVRSRLLGRTMLYTAVTWAAETVVLVGVRTSSTRSSPWLRRAWNGTVPRTSKGRKKTTTALARSSAPALASIHPLTHSATRPEITLFGTHTIYRKTWIAADPCLAETRLNCETVQMLSTLRACRNRRADVRRVGLILRYRPCRIDANPRVPSRSSSPSSTSAAQR
jgi:hypothetical protein